MKASDAIDYIGCTALVAIVVVLGCYLDRAKHPAVPNPPDTAAMWQQNNTAIQNKCRDMVVAEVLRMRLPAQPDYIPGLANAMLKGYRQCLIDNKVMI